MFRFTVQVSRFFVQMFRFRCSSIPFSCSNVSVIGVQMFALLCSNNPFSVFKYSVLLFKCSVSVFRCFRNRCSSLPKYAFFVQPSVPTEITLFFGIPSKQNLYERSSPKRTFGTTEMPRFCSQYVSFRFQLV